MTPLSMKSTCKSLFHCNDVSISYRDSALNNGVALNLGQRSFKVIENGTIRKLGYGFLFAFHSNSPCKPRR